MDRIRLAIVGCGNISFLNAPGYLQHPRCDVVALCDTEPGRAERRAREWGITPRVYSDFKQVLEDGSIDAIELLTPTWMHADQIVAALAAGKHVSCQKPLAITLAEANRVADAVARARTTFRVTENFLYYPPILKAKELLDAGVIGEPSLVRIHTTRVQHITGGVMELDPDAMVWRRDRGRNPGGPLYDDGVHKYATAALWIGEIGDISAIVTHGTDILAETPAAAMWRFKGRNCLGIIDYTSAPEILQGRRVLRDPRQSRHHLGHSLHRRDARHARGRPTARNRDGQLPGSRRLASRVRRRRGGFRRQPARWAPAGAGRPHGEAHPQCPARDLRSLTHRAPRRAGAARVSVSRGGEPFSASRRASTSRGPCPRLE
jgi:predicted dehydrogenase